MLLNIVTLISLALFYSKASAETASSTTSAPAATHTISVGADGLNFSPREINASIGDIIEYRFYPQNHSVARAAFGPNPCIPYEDTGAGLIGFWSGFRPTAVVSNTPPIFQLRVNDSAPIFYYCSAPNACFEGMIGVINPNATETFAQQFQYALNATIEFSPLEYFPAEVSATRTTTATGATMTPTAPPTSTSSTPPAASSSHTSLGTGPIVGIAIGGFAVAVLAAALIYMCGRHKTVNEMLRQSTIAPSNHNSYQPAAAGVTEANYSNMQKTPMSNNTQFSDRYGAPGTETESYRSMSPPLDERSAMMGMHPMHFQQGQGNASPGLGVLSPGSPGYPSPTYHDGQPHEMENGTVQSRQYNAPPEHQGPHELPSGSPTNPSATDSRPFSYTDSETGFSTERKH